MMNRFEHHFEVMAPLDRVIEFHQDARSLRKLTPLPIIVQIHMVQPLSEGSVVDFTLWLGPIPVRWLAVHHDINLPNEFSDSMMRGPFEAWVHQHRFKFVDEGRTLITDTIQAIPGSHPLWGLVSKLLWRNLALLFTYRRWKTKRLLECRRR